MASSGTKGRSSSIDEMASSGKNGISSSTMTSFCAVMVSFCEVTISFWDVTISFWAAETAGDAETEAGSGVSGTAIIDTALFGRGGSGLRSRDESTVRLPRGDVDVRLRESCGAEDSVTCDGLGVCSVGRGMFSS